MSLAAEASLLRTATQSRDRSSDKMPQSGYRPRLRLGRGVPLFAAADSPRPTGSRKRRAKAGALACARELSISDYVKRGFSTFVRKLKWRIGGTAQLLK